MLKRVYVAGPFRAYNTRGEIDAWAVHRNISRAEEVGHLVLLAGASPFVPHKITEHQQGSLPDETFLEADMVWLDVSDAIIMVVWWEASSGSSAEREHAAELGIPVFYVEMGEDGQQRLPQEFINWIHKGLDE